MTRIYHPDAWRYGVIPDGYSKAVDAYVRSRPELVQAAIEKAQEKGISTEDPLGTWGCVGFLGRDVLADNVPYYEFIAWAKAYRREIGQ